MAADEVRVALVAGYPRGRCRGRGPERDQEANLRRRDARHGQETDERNDHGHGATEQHHLSVQRDPSGHHGAQAEQGGQVEDVRPDHYASPHRLLVVQERGNRGGDLGSVGRQRRRHPEQCFRKPEPFAHSLQAGHEHPARGQAADCADEEGNERSPTAIAA